MGRKRQFVYNCLRMSMGSMSREQKTETTKIFVKDASLVGRCLA